MGLVKLPWYSCYTKAKTLASKWRLLGSLASSDSLHWEGDSPQNITAKSAKWPEIKMIWVWFICIKKHKLGFPIRSFPIHSLFTDQLFCWGNWVEKCGELRVTVITCYNLFIISGQMWPGLGMWWHVDAVLHGRGLLLLLLHLASRRVPLSWRSSALLGKGAESDDIMQSVWFSNLIPQRPQF